MCLGGFLGWSFGVRLTLSVVARYSFILSVVFGVTFVCLEAKDFDTCEEARQQPVYGLANI